MVSLGRLRFLLHGSFYEYKIILCPTMFKLIIIFIFQNSNLNEVVFLDRETTSIVELAFPFSTSMMHNVFNQMQVSTTFSSSMVAVETQPRARSSSTPLSKRSYVFLYFEIRNSPLRLISISSSNYHFRRLF